MSHTDNFYIYTDSDGKMPVLRRKPMKSASHRWYTRYSNNVPVSCVPYPGQVGVWDYQKSRYVALIEIKFTRTNVVAADVAWANEAPWILAEGKITMNKHDPE